MPHGTKFEVGKEYVCTVGVRAKCLFAYETSSYYCMIGEVTQPYASWKLGEKYPFSGGSWSEHREPRTVKGYANIWGGPDGSVYIGSVYPTRGRAVQERSLRAAEAARREGGAPASEYDSLDIIEISWTEKT